MYFNELVGNGKNITIFSIDAITGLWYGTCRHIVIEHIRVQYSGFLGLSSQITTLGDIFQEATKDLCETSWK